METHHEFVQENGQIAKQPVSLTEYSQTHPYQYLKQLNNIYQTCNKASGKDFSSASMIKLPWKKFKPVSIPKCFQETYNLQRKQTLVIRNSDDNQNSEEVQKQKKFWREHGDLMKKYYRNNLANNNMAKHRHEQRRKHLFSAKSCMGLQNKNSFSGSIRNLNTSNVDLTKKSARQKQNQEHLTTLKTQSDQSTHGQFFQSKASIPYNRSTPNLFIESTNMTNSKKKSLKSKYLNQQKTVEQEVLDKLKKISMMPHLNRAKTANLLSKQGKGFRQREKLQSSTKKLANKYVIEDSRIKQNEYLQFNMKQDLIERYKNKIKQIDCSISEKNVKKTADVLKQMQEIYNIDIEDY